MHVHNDVGFVINKAATRKETVRNIIQTINANKKDHKYVSRRCHPSDMLDIVATDKFSFCCLQPSTMSAYYLTN